MVEVNVDRCKYCNHYLGEKGGLPTCRAFPDGIDYKLYDRPWKDCLPGHRFELNHLLEKEYRLNCNDWSRYPDDISFSECYEAFKKSGLPVMLEINSKRFFRIIGKFKKYLIDGERLIFQVPIEMFYSMNLSTLDALIDDFGHIFHIKNRTYGSLNGIGADEWKYVTTLLDPHECINEYQVGNYIRVMEKGEVGK